MIVDIMYSVVLGLFGFEENFVVLTDFVEICENLCFYFIWFSSCGWLAPKYRRRHLEKLSNSNLATLKEFFN